MLSLSSTRAASITRHHQKLRKAAVASAILSARQQRPRLTTAAVTSTSKQQQPLVISRRAWLEFKESKGITKRRPDPSKRPKSDDEKPWPRNVQIAGYVAGAVAVPYIILWTITSNPTLREWFGPYIPLDKLRKHYGKLEWDAQSYSEELENASQREKTGNDESQLLNDYYQFPEEPPFHERRQQELVEAMSESDVAVTLSLTSSSSSSLLDEIVTKQISAKTVANAKNLLGHFPSVLNAKDGNVTVAVDFLDQKNDEKETGTLVIESASMNDTLMTDADTIANDQIMGGSHNPSLGSVQLSKETQTMSKWAYVPQNTDESSKKSANNSSSATRASQLTQMEIEMGRLEYEISELEKNLRDPMCTRSIDDMTTELRQAKRDLSRLTWKRRFGLSR